MKKRIDEESTSKKSKKTKRLDRLFLRSFLVVFAIAVAGGIAGQANALASIQAEQAEIAEQIAQEKKKAEEFEYQREYYNSDSYIEQIAREQLGMLKPNEILYINRSQS